MKLQRRQMTTATTIETGSRMQQLQQMMKPMGRRLKTVQQCLMKRQHYSARGLIQCSEVSPKLERKPKV